MNQTIESELRKLEKEENVTVLYACESGSRAWGFESGDSDYDVRFIYLQATEWYLTIQNKRDVIERSTDGRLDISGWDLKKAFELFRRSNPPLLEWLQSPIVYAERSTVIQRMRCLMPDYYSPTACMHHYLHMAEGNLREYLHGDEVWTKKYFYVLRPVLACLWIERGLGVVPTEFTKLVDAVVDDAYLRDEIAKLLEAKRTGHELRKGRRNEVISGFIEKQMARLDRGRLPSSETRDCQRLDDLFLETMIEVNGPSIEQRAEGRARDALRETKCHSR